jgi:hypothetical protein
LEWWNYEIGRTRTVGADRINTADVNRKGCLMLKYSDECDLHEVIGIFVGCIGA